MPFFPRPSPLPGKVGLFRRMPPAVFPAVLGLLGLVMVWNNAARMFPAPTELIDFVAGMVTLLFLYCVAAYVAKIALRPSSLIDDLKTLPGRTGLAAAGVGFIVQAALLVDLSTVLAAFCLAIGAAVVLAVALFVGTRRLRGNDTSGPPTPAMHLVFVGFVPMAAAAVPLGAHPVLVLWLIGYCTLAALLITALTIGPLITGASTPPLRPLQAIHLAPPAFVSIGCLLTGQSTLAVIALVCACAIAALLIFRLRWMMEGGFSGFWSAFTFPVTAFAGALLMAAEVFGSSAVRVAGALVLIATTIYVPVIVLKVLKLWAKGTLAVKTNASTA